MSSTKRRTDKPKAEQFAALTRQMLETRAWRALPPVAQALYPHLKLCWSGPRQSNNGRIALSVRQAAEKLGVAVNTAAKGFHELQRMGFLVVTRPAALGFEGEAKGHEFELTEIPLPHSDKNIGRRLYLEWQPGRDFPVHRTRTNNPTGRNGGGPTRKKPRLKSCDGPVSKLATFP